MPNRLRNPKTRWMMVLGNFSLVAALLLWNFVRPIAGARPGLTIAWLDGASGLFFGVSIGANLSAIRCARRSRPDMPPQE
jgi:uncharacterized membrane protein HdeD (DUF308 family)